MALNFENIRVFLKGSGFELIIFPKFVAFQLQPETRRLDGSFEASKPKGASVLSRCTIGCELRDRCNSKIQFQNLIMPDTLLGGLAYIIHTILVAGLTKVTQI